MSTYILANASGCTVSRIPVSKSVALQTYLKTTYHLYVDTPKDPTIVKWLLRGFNQNTGHKIGVQYFHNGRLVINGIPELKEIVLP